MYRILSIVIVSALILTGLFYSYNKANHYSKPLPPLESPNEEVKKKNLLFSKDSYMLYHTANKLSLKNRTNNLVQNIILPESELKLSHNIESRNNNQDFLLNYSFSRGLILSGKNSDYIISLEPNFQLLGSYPRIDTIEKLILVNKQKNFLYFYSEGILVKKYSVSTGQFDWYTPEGEFHVSNKIEYPRGKSPDAPMGPRWMGLAVPYSYDRRGNKTDGGPDPRAPVGQKFGIHGTNDESTIGTHASGGCIRMYNQEVLELYDMVPVGTKVRIINN